MKTNTIIWDWNGTLLNDIDLCISSINTLLKKRNLPVLDSKKYKEVFSFPVKDYYKKVGFDFSKEDFSIPAKEFIDLYNSNVATCQLHKNSIQILKQFKEKQFRQFVLSAMKQDMLDETLEHQGIIDFFEAVQGIDDHYAHSKLEQGKKLLSGFDLETENCCIVGDTSHDYEVAKELGIQCILIADGHQSKERLKATGVNVLDSLCGLTPEFVSNVLSS